MKRMRLQVVMWMLLAAAPVWAAAPTTQPQVAFDRWYTVLLGGRPAGWSHTRVELQAGRFTTTDQMKILINRGTATLAIGARSRFVETQSGRPIKAESVSRMGPQESGQRYVFTDKGIEVTSWQGDQRHTSLAPNPTGAGAHWLPPVAEHRAVQRQVAAGARQISTWSLDPSLGPSPTRTDYRLEGRQNVAVLGKVVPAMVWQETNSHLPGLTTTDYTDEAGWSIKTTIDLLPGMRLEVVQSDRELALRQISPSQVPELMTQTFIKPDKPVPDARQSRLAIYDLTFTPAQGAVAGHPLPAGLLPTTGCQRVVWSDEYHARVVVNLDSPTAAGSDLPTPADRRPSLMIDSDDGRVLALRDQALRGLAADASPVQKAKTLRRFVYRFIRNKDLSIGMATAGETARSAEGDCTEHAVLLAALLRAAGIPSRTVSGLLYVDEFLGQKQVFGYHMWTQAWLDTGQGAHWVDLDAVLPHHAFDAAHIALGVSSMDDQSGAMGGDVLDLLPVLGRLSIAVR